MARNPIDPAARIRLACSDCDRSDRDGITAADLAACRAAGWTDITAVQAYEQSLVTYDDPAAAPADFDATAWYTHLGLCPDCRRAAGEGEPSGGDHGPTSR